MKLLLNIYTHKFSSQGGWHQRGFIFKSWLVGTEMAELSVCPLVPGWVIKQLFCVRTFGVSALRDDKVIQKKHGVVIEPEFLVKCVRAGSTF